MPDEERFASIEEKVESLESDFKELSEKVLSLITEVGLLNKNLRGVREDLCEASRFMSLAFSLFNVTSAVETKDSIAERKYEEMRQALVKFSESYPPKFQRP